MKTLDLVIKVLTSLVLSMPILGALGVVPGPKRDMYNSDTAFAFIDILMKSRYVIVIDALVFALAIYLLWTKREALAALLILPVTVNIVGFHAFLDGGLLTPGAILGNILLVLNAYFLWKNRGQYQSLIAPGLGQKQTQQLS